MATTMAPWVLASGLALALMATRAAPPAANPACEPGFKSMARYELVFGTGSTGAGRVSDAAWADFLAREVTPRFPAGLTVLHGDGQWQGQDGRIAREGAIWLLIMAEPGPAAAAAIEAIRSRYKSLFSQDSVMRVDSVACVSF